MSIEQEFNRTYFGCFGEQTRHCKCYGICIHHTETSSPKRTRSALKNKGLSTHFEVDRDGTIYIYRDPKYICYHCGSSNPYLIGVDVTHLKGQEFTIVQLRAVHDLVEYLCEKYSIPQVVHETLSGIYPHRALCSTSCPDTFPMEIFEKGTI